MPRTELCIALALALSACKATTDYPDHVGGGGGGGGGGPDARITTDGGGDAAPGNVSGTVCIATDLLAPAACPTLPRAGIAIDITGTTTTAVAAASGAFTIDAGTATRVVLEVGAGDPALVPSLVPIAVDGTAVIAPVPRKAELVDLEELLGASVPDGTGVIALYVVDGTGAAVSGVSVTAPPGTDTIPFYDDGGSWTEGGATGALGAALVFGVPEGTINLDAQAPTGAFTLTAVPIIDGHLTFVSAIAP